MAKDYYLPKTEGALIIWLENFIVKIALHGATLGLDSTTISELEDLAQAIIDDINLTTQKKDDWKAQVENKNDTKKDNLETITSEVKQFKEETTYTTGIGDSLGVIGTEDGFDSATYKPDLTVENIQQGRLLKFSKSKTDGVNVYRRNKGTGEWTFLALDNRSPYLDGEAFSAPTEVEYKVVGVIDLEEIGKDSDTVEITTAEVS